MQHPYQCLAICRRVGENGRTILFGASGPKIASCDLTTGNIISVWPKTSSSTSEEAQHVEDEGPPGKKRKLEKSSESAPNVIKLLVTRDNQHLVAVTAEDKCVRVFQITSDGQLEELSQRCMPKRPSAITMSSDRQSILVGDKFGDVYCIPLLPDPSTTAISTTTTQEPSPPKRFVPAASHLTVHSARNRRALEEQLKTAAAQAASSSTGTSTAHPTITTTTTTTTTSSATTSSEPAFHPTPVLGHVSMLTDLVAARVRDSIGGGPRDYVLSADRDEHIRVSRGPPQAHVIEGFCLGHGAFVSRLCLLDAADDADDDGEVLVSGGGDGELFVWAWREGGRLIGTVEVRERLAELFGDVMEGKEVAVAGMWALPRRRRQRADGEGKEHALLVALEGIPLLCGFQITLDGPEELGIREAFTRLPGNPLDLVILDDSVIVALDNLGQQPGLEAGSGPRTDAVPRLLSLNMDAGLFERDAPLGAWEANDQLERVLQPFNQLGTVDADAKAVRELVYGVENLRKRGGGDD